MKKRSLVIITTVFLLVFLSLSISAQTKDCIIEIYSLPIKTDYIYEYDGEQSTYFDTQTGENVKYFNYNILLNGLSLKVSYNDGTSVDINFDDCLYYIPTAGKITAYYDFGEITITYNKVMKIGLNHITVNYSGASVGFDIDVEPNPVSTVEVKQLPAKTNYYLGYDSEKATYYDNNGNAVEYDSYKFIADDMTLLINGDTTINLNDLGGCNYYTKNSTEYAVYKYLNWKVVVSHPISLNVGSNEYTVEFLGKTATFNVNYFESKNCDFNNDGYINTLDHILFVSNLGSKTNYQNEIFDLNFDGYINSNDYMMLTTKFN